MFQSINPDDLTGWAFPKTGRQNLIGSDHLGLVRIWLDPYNNIQWVTYTSEQACESEQFHLRSFSVPPIFCWNPRMKGKQKWLVYLQTCFRVGIKKYVLEPHFKWIFRDKMPITQTNENSQNFNRRKFWSQPHKSL